MSGVNQIFLRHRNFNCIKSFNIRYMCTSIAKSIDDRVSTSECVSDVKDFSEIPGPKGLPYFGTLLQYRKGPFKKFDVHDMQEVLMSRYKEHGPIMKETINGNTGVRVFCPDLVQQVYQNEGMHPKIIPLLDSSRKYREERGMSPGMGNMNGQEWYDLRAAVKKITMRPSEVKRYLPSVNEVSHDLLAVIRNNRDANLSIDDFFRYLCRWNMETAGKICFERRLGCLEDGQDSHTQRMINANYNIFKYSTKLMFSLPFYKLHKGPLASKHFQAEDYFYSNGQKLVDEAVQEVNRLVSEDKLADDKFVFLSYLIANPSLDYKDVSMTTLTLFADGLNATAPALLFVLYLLAKNPIVQEKAFQEVSEFMGKEDQVTPEILNKLTFMKACVKESYRFYPLNLDIKRKLDCDIDIGGYNVPANTIFELCPFVNLLSEKYYKNAMEFQPDRWMRNSEHSEDDMHPYVLLPFSHGPRMCIGRRIAEQDIYTTLAKILVNFKITTSSPELGLKYMILQFPDRPVTFSFLDR